MSNSRATTRPVLHPRHAYSLLTLALLTLFTGCGSPDGLPASQPPVALRLFAGAGLRPPVEELARTFGAQHGIQVECDYAGSEVLLSKLKHARQGDLYIPGDVRYVDQAAAEGMIAQRAEVAFLVPILLVKKGNPKGVTSLSDLARPGLRLGLADDQACAIGKSTLALLKKNGVDLQAVEKNKVFNSLTVNELGVQVKLGQVDATVVWDATATFFAEDTTAVAIPPEQNIISTVPVAVLSFSKQPEWAARFLAFVQSDESRRVFEGHGYSTKRP